MKSRLMTLAAAVVLSASIVLAQGAQTFTGTVSDSMCGAHHMMAGKSAAECTRECVKEGSDFALVVRNRVYTLKGNKMLLDKYTGMNVIVKGKVSGTTITVDSVTPSKG